MFCFERDRPTLRRLWEAVDARKEDGKYRQRSGRKALAKSFHLSTSPFLESKMMERFLALALSPHYIFVGVPDNTGHKD